MSIELRSSRLRIKTTAFATEMTMYTICRKPNENVLLSKVLPMQKEKENQILVKQDETKAIILEGSTN